MTVDIAWPETIPLPQLDYQGQERTTTLVADPVVNGRISRRSPRRAVYHEIKATWMLKLSKWKELQTFYLDTLGQGTAAFSMDLRFPLNSDLTNWMLRFSADLGYTHKEGHYLIESNLFLITPTELIAAAIGGGVFTSDGDSLFTSDDDEFLVMT